MFDLVFTACSADPKWPKMSINTVLTIHVKTFRWWTWKYNFTNCQCVLPKSDSYIYLFEISEHWLDTDYFTDVSVQFPVLLCWDQSRQTCWQKCWSHKPTGLLAHWYPRLTQAFQDINKTHFCIFSILFFQPSRDLSPCINLTGGIQSGSTSTFLNLFCHCMWQRCQARTQTHSWQTKFYCFRCFRITAAVFS